MHYRKMTKNYIFRKFECELSKEETAKLCFKSVRLVTRWDEGKEIPPECKRLMRMSKCKALSHLEEWQNFKMVNGKLEMPTGNRISAQQLLTAVALLEIQSDLELKTTAKLLKYARAIINIKLRKGPL
ncbi:phage protein [Vibrio fluvialis]|nr:phage protein [Vibrio fluvialis]